MTVTQELLEGKLGQPLGLYVADRREIGMSWDHIAGLLNGATDSTITGETLRRWYGETAT